MAIEAVDSGGAVRLISYSCTIADVSWRWQSAHLPVAFTSAAVWRLTSIFGRFDCKRRPTRSTPAQHDGDEDTPKRHGLLLESRLLRR